MTQPRTMSSLKSVFKNRRNTVKVRQNTFLEYTWRFYHLGNRGISLDDQANGVCVYEPTRISPGCAIGQHNPKNCGLHGLSGAVTDYTVWSKLPSWMRDLDAYFLKKTQQLHDLQSNWTTTGLNSIGVEKRDSISDFINET